MKGLGGIVAITTVMVICPVAYSDEGSDYSEFVNESSDAPGSLWGSEGIGPEWQRTNPSNVTILGSFSENDSVDVFALEVPMSNWSKVGFSIEGSGSVSIRVMRLNQTSWAIESYANGSLGEIELDQGTHAIRIERLGHDQNLIEYNFTLNHLGSVDLDEGEYVDLSSKFTPFYIFAGVLLITPLLVVLWWNKDNFGRGGGARFEEHEKLALNVLRERFGDGEIVSLEEGRIHSSLGILSDDYWASATERLGEAEIRHFTKDLDICVWRSGKEGNSIEIGIRTGDSKWKMAAIRIFSPTGEEVVIDSVEQNLLHENDEVFIGDLEENTTKFIRIKTLDIPNEINLHLSGLSRGEPVAAVPTKSTPALSEE
tara:strand:+ start:16855 stop:17964 length:1110 start_codon:yes stop_codon:yes gene_type:complete